jgi:CRP-like cAMP-binding protein
VTEVQLLTLEAGDFRQLIEQYPDLREKISRIADSRLSGDSEPPPASTPS